MSEHQAIRYAPACCILNKSVLCMYNYLLTCCISFIIFLKKIIWLHFNHIILHYHFFVIFNLHTGLFVSELGQIFFFLRTCHVARIYLQEGVAGTIQTEQTCVWVKYSAQNTCTVLFYAALFIWDGHYFYPIFWANMAGVLSFY